MKAGMRSLIESFGRSIVEGTRVPIPYREILLTTRIMDAIFAQLDAQRQRVQAVLEMPLKSASTNLGARGVILILIAGEPARLLVSCG